MVCLKKAFKCFCKLHVLSSHLSLFNTLLLFCDDQNDSTSVLIECKKYFETIPVTYYAYKVQNITYLAEDNLNIILASSIVLLRHKCFHNLPEVCVLLHKYHWSISLCHSMWSLCIADNNSSSRGRFQSLDGI
jgi:hypothetical protein